MDTLNQDNQAVNEILKEITNRLDCIFDNTPTTEQQVKMVNDGIEPTVNEYNELLEQNYGVKILETEITPITISDKGYVEKGCVRQIIQLPRSLQFKNITINNNSFSHCFTED